MRSILIHAWNLHKSDSEYFIVYTDWVYLNEIVKYYDKVILLSPTDNESNFEKKSKKSIQCFKNVEVYELPYSTNYIGSVKYFFQYKSAYKKLSKEVNEVYSRYPYPYGWLQMLYFKSHRRIIHFVGDPIDTIEKNPNLSSIRKVLYKTFFWPEHLFYMKACKGANVFTNGQHLAQRLKKYKIEAVSLISSTLNEDDFYNKGIKNINYQNPKIIYVGYLNKAKGLETVLLAFQLLQQKIPNAELTIIGMGELEQQLKVFVQDNNMKNVLFTGHIDNRKILNGYLRNSDIFCFASLSEGSPRVILEAMANGLAVVSTPVGSLPHIFKDEEDILFADYHNAEEFFEKLNLLIQDNQLYNSIVQKALAKVSNYKINNFIKTIFKEA